MKEMNRRAFLTLTGAAVVALSLAGCDGEPSVPPAPPAPPASESKELALFKAINEVWYEVNKQVAPNPTVRRLPTSQSLQPAPLKPMTLKWTRRISANGTCLMMYSTTTKTVRLK